MAINRHQMLAALELFLWVVALGGCLCLYTGCASTTQAINETDMQQAKEMVQAMRDAGIAGFVELEVGSPGIYIKQKYGLDLGVTLKVRMLANPGAAP